MKIAFVITRADAVGGATIHVRDLARALMQNGHQASVLLGGTGAARTEIEAAGIPVVSLHHLRRRIDPIRDILAVREMSAAIRQLDPDVVSAHTAKAGCVARLACSGLNIPVLYTPHGWAITDRISGRQGAIYRLIERFVAPMATAIINVCDYEHRLALDHHIGQDRQHVVIYNGMPDVAPRLRAMPGYAPPRLAMVARFEPPKDHLTLVEALAGLRDLEWDLDLIGDGPLLEDVRSRVEALGMSKRVRFIGSTSNVASLLAASQVFVLSSKSEAFPRSILEAMRAGLPVVATRVGGVAEAIVSERNGFLVPGQSVTALREALGRLISSGETRVRYGAAARQDYERRFTFGRMLTETVSVYEEVASMQAAALACRA